VTPAVEALGLSKRYGRGAWALNDCCLAAPQGRVVALVGPNGAGKTTLMQLAVGLLRPTRGEVQVLGWSPRTHQLLVLSRVGYLAQDRPLYRNFTVEMLLGFGRRLNPRWDDRLARIRLESLGVPFDRRITKLSGGQQAQVALTLAVAKRPDLLLLDEPLANLDPLARREFGRSLLETVTEQGLTVIYSSHVVAELERFCDYLILLSAGRVQLAGEVDRLLADHRVLTGPAEALSGLEHDPHVVDARPGPRQAIVVARGSARTLDRAWNSHPVTLDDLVLAYMNNPLAAALPAPEPAETAS
jgi:ABC-2 type transport system ATP-binding protein